MIRPIKRLWKRLLNEAGFNERPSDYPTCPACGKPADQTSCGNPIHLHSPRKS